MAAKFGLLIDAKTKGENNIKRLGNSMQGVEGKAKNLGRAVKGVGLAFKSLFAAAAVAGFSSFVKGAIDSADAFGKLSTRTGIAADKLQAFANAGKLADVSQSDLETGLRTLARTQAEAADGVATYADAYKKLGIGVTQADGSLKASDKLLGEIADKFADLPNGPEKAAIAMDIFGRSGSKLITLLNGGTEALERFNYETSENFAQNAELFNDKITTLQIQFDGFRKQLADFLLPTLNSIIEAFSVMLSSENDFTGFFAAIDVSLKGLAITLAATAMAVVEIVETLKTAAIVLGAINLGRFGEAGEALRSFGAGAADRYGTNKEIMDLILGRIDAPTNYGGGSAGLDPVDLRFGQNANQGQTGQKQIVKMSQDEFNLRQAIRDARGEENEIALVNAQFALEQFEIGSKFNGDVLGARNALLDAELDKNIALTKIEDNRAKAAEQAAEEQRAAAQARLEADPGYQMKQQLEEMLKIENQVAAGATAIGNAFSNAFTSVVTGSKTAQEALADMMSAVAEHFMNMAAQIIAKQLAMILYGTIMKALGISGGGFTMSNGMSGDFTQADPSTLSSLGYQFAEGGYVSGPTRALVGEGGESEYIIPESKMRESMARYSRGARGGSVIPGAGDSGTSGEGGGTAVAAPIDVRYTVERINSVDYVTADQFQTGMRQAATQGAKQGEQQTLKRLQMSGSTRKRLGL